MDAPPAVPQFPALAPTALVAANAAGVISLKLTCPTNPGENTVVRAAAPLKPGTTTTADFRILGLCPVPVADVSDITALYTARFGVPPVGQKVFVEVNQFVEGYQDIPKIFSAIVPQAA